MSRALNLSRGSNSLDSASGYSRVRVNVRGWEWEKEGGRGRDMEWGEGVGWGEKGGGGYSGKVNPTKEVRI